MSQSAKSVKVVTTNSDLLFGATANTFARPESQTEEGSKEATAHQSSSSSAAAASAPVSSTIATAELETAAPRNSASATPTVSSIGDNILQGSLDGKVSSEDPSKLSDTTWLQVRSLEELSNAVLRIAAARDCDYVIVDCPTVSSPQDLAKELQDLGSTSLRIDCLLCVLDSNRVLNEFNASSRVESENDSSASPLSTVDGSDSNGAPSSVPENDTEADAMLLASCVENANVIAVTRTDHFEHVSKVLSALNLGAVVIQFQSDVLVPLSKAVNTNLYDSENLALNATWRRVLQSCRKSDTKQARLLPKAAKDVAFVYHARRPFHPTRFYEHIKDVTTFTGVFRSTGKIWLPTRMNAPLEWEQAGDSATLRAGKSFWATLPEDEWGVSEEERKQIMNDWDNQYGDRETEMVFIGLNFDKDRLQGLLDGCLLQDEEMVFTNLWENFDDPFEQWVPLPSEEQYEEDMMELPATDQENDSSAQEESSYTAGESDAQVSDSPGSNEQSTSVESVETDPLVDGGETDVSTLPDKLPETSSALDVFERVLGGEDAPVSSRAPSADFEDDDDIVVSSWDRDVADGILRQMPKAGLPVTIVTGFLGSGKTTLLNRILTADHGLRIAVLVNEFGEVDIDNQLIEKGNWSASDEILELANGCICCSINDSFVRAIQRILEKKDKVDYIIVETTGIADPVPVINSLMVSDIADDVRVDGILTVVDTDNFDGEKHMGSEAALSQILAADTILLSKTDLASYEKVEQTINYIKSVRPAARILKSRHGRIPVSMILDVGMRLSDSPALMDPVPQKSRSHGNSGDHQHHHGHPDGHAHSDHVHDTHDDAERRDHSSHSHEHCGPDCSDPSHDHSHRNHLEVDGFVSTSFKSDKPLVAELFMERFLQHLPEGVFRAKGLLHFHGYGSRYVFNLSGRRYQFEEDNWPDGVAPGNQLVIIGRNLNIDELRKTLEECHAPMRDTHE